VSQPLEAVHRSDGAVPGDFTVSQGHGSKAFSAASDRESGGGGREIVDQHIEVLQSSGRERAQAFAPNELAVLKTATDLKEAQGPPLHQGDQGDGIIGALRFRSTPIHHREPAT
jgi:hypothetical protein